MTHETHRVMAVIVGEDDDDVARCGGGRRLKWRISAHNRGGGRGRSQRTSPRCRRDDQGGSDQEMGESGHVSITRFTALRLLGVARAVAAM